MAERKYDWDAIEDCRKDGLTWAETVDSLDLEISWKSLSKMYSKRKRAGLAKHPLPPQQGSGDGPSLADWTREKRMEQKRAMCPVCQLDDSIRAQIAHASDHGITRKEQVAWLEEVVGVKLTSPQLQAHFSGRHDE